MPTIREDDLTDPQTLQLIAEHVAAMRADSPEESCHVLSDDALRSPNVTVWTAWEGDTIVGMGALAALSGTHAEIKSMRTTAQSRGLGVGRLLVRFLIDEAASRGITTLWLETGSDATFLPARSLYESEGFVECDPFGTYRPDPNSTFMMREVAEPTISAGWM
ncbi:GNAT family N-acetyltransferase [Microbacterium sp. YY-03]|uniref:GNAT family N-acetyltransferase n=1 Tax=Microbacterium sp. YY-03 TaxID=3421636 RepID=UPI003D170E4C